MTDFVSVPCNGCKACCKQMAVLLEPGEDPSDYRTEMYQGQPMLAHKSNGDCVYLGAEGCTIHERAPAACRKMDCRKTALKMTEGMAESSNVIEIWRRGRELNEVQDV